MAAQDCEVSIYQIKVRGQWSKVVTSQLLQLITQAGGHIGTILDRMHICTPNEINRLMVGPEASELRTLRQTYEARRGIMCIVVPYTEQTYQGISELVERFTALDPAINYTLLHSFASIGSVVSAAQEACVTAAIEADESAAQEACKPLEEHSVSSDTTAPLAQQYTLTAEIISELGITPRTYVIFTDGSSLIGGNGGYALYFAQGPIVKSARFGRVDEPLISPDGPERYVVTNNRAEGLAFYHSFAHLHSCLDTWDDALIVTDSMFWKNMFLEFMPKWSQAKFSKMRNPDLTTTMWKQYCDLQAAGKTIRFRHVYSHGKKNEVPSLPGSADHYCRFYNAIVDKIAGHARCELQDDEHQFICVDMQSIQKDARIRKRR